MKKNIEKQFNHGGHKVITNRNLANLDLFRLLAEKFESRVVCCNLGKRFGRRSRGNCEVSLHRRLEAVDVGLDHWELLNVIQGSQLKFLTAASALQADFSGRLGIADPLGSASRGDEISPSFEFEQIDWSRIEFPTLAAADFQNVDVRWSDAKPTRNPNVRLNSFSTVLGSRKTDPFEFMGILD